LVKRSGAVALALPFLAGCAYRVSIPPRPLAIPAAVAPDDSGAILARYLAPVLYLQRDETFPLERVVAVLHPERRLIAYHVLWRDDVHGAWLPWGHATDQEIVWVGYDSSGRTTDLWTYWHGAILHAPWSSGGQIVVDVQWGKHGSMPRQTIDTTLPRAKPLELFYGAAWLLLPDLWLGRLVRKGPWCFCHGYARYRAFTEPVVLATRIDAVVRTATPDESLAAVFGRSYARKPNWP
jgi:hypothetical protein